MTELKKLILFKKIISALVILFFIPSQWIVAEAQKSEFKIEKPEPFSPRSLIGVQVPPILGITTDRYSGSSGKLVIHIQDSHAHFEAQKNISKLIKFFFEKFPKETPKVVLLEGANGYVDTSPLAAIEDEAIKDRVATYFLKQGLITGAEYYSIMSPKDSLLLGVDDRKLYLENLDYFRKGQQQEEIVSDEISKIRTVLEVLEEKVFPKPLLEINRMRKSYEGGEPVLSQYCSLLRKYWRETGRLEILYPNFSKILKVAELESVIHFDRLNDEMMNLVSTLQKKLDRESLEKMVQKSLLYRLGKIDQGEYFRMVYELASTVQIDFKLFPNLSAFFESITLREEMDATKIFVELQEVDQKVRGSLYRSDDEKELDRFDRYLALIERLASLTLTNDEYRFYLREKENYPTGQLGKMLGEMAARHQQVVDTNLTMEKTSQSLGILEGFYETALKRDEAIIANVLKEMEQEQSPVSILITGGFHTTGVTQEFRKKKISYMVVSPKVTTMPDHSIYLSTMMDLASPLDQALRTLAQRLSAPIVFAQDPFGMRANWERIVGKAVIFKDLLEQIRQTKGRNLIEGYIRYVNEQLVPMKRADGTSRFTDQELKAKIERLKSVAQRLTVNWDQLLSVGESFYVPVQVGPSIVRIIRVDKGAALLGNDTQMEDFGQIDEGHSFYVYGQDYTSVYQALINVSQIQADVLEPLLARLDTGALQTLAGVFSKIKVDGLGTDYPLADQFVKFQQGIVLRLSDVVENQTMLTRSEASVAEALTPVDSAAMDVEKKDAVTLSLKLREPLDAKGNPDVAKRFLKGGFKEEGFGVAEGAAIDGSRAFGDEGNQGYYVDRVADGRSGKEVFLSTVASMTEFFKRRAQRIGKPIRYVIKPGIGGQHTPFQGLADSFQVLDPTTGIVVGEYELGKDYEASLSAVLEKLGAGWDQVAVIPSSKSGSTDETMMIFVEILRALLKNIAQSEGLDGERFAAIVLDSLHQVNFDEQGKERPGKDLFKGFNLTFIRDKANAQGLAVTYDQVKKIFGKVLGNMFFETTDRPEASRLSAFIRNSGLDRELGEDAPGFGAMFDNVGGRWTADLHMMAFLAYYGLDAESYWKARYEGIRGVRLGNHAGVKLGNEILDRQVTDIALVVPDEFFWFGKAIEQNFNESVWQEGFANLVTVRQSQWENQRGNYAGQPRKLVINLTDLPIAQEEVSFGVFKLNTPDLSRLNPQQLALTFADLYSTFYGVTETVGDRLIVRALHRAGYTSDQIKTMNLSDLDDGRTKIVQQNLYLRQPYVELGKGLLESRLKALQARESAEPGSIAAEMEKIKAAARDGKAETNIPGLRIPEGGIKDVATMAQVIRQAVEYAQAHNRKFVPFIYVEGEKFSQLREHLIALGLEWVMQGTGDQHISYQQVLAQPQKYLPMIVSFVPESPVPGLPAIGFAKGYLHHISSNMVRDFFAEASYRALTELRKEEGGQGIFMRLSDVVENQTMVAQAMTRVPPMVAERRSEANWLEKIRGAFRFSEEPRVKVKNVELVETVRASKEGYSALERRYDLVHATALAVRHTLRWLSDTASSFISKRADKESAQWLRAYFNSLSWFKGKVVIGEGERDKAPMLYIGEMVGQGQEEVDMAMDVVEVTKGLIKKAVKGTVSIVAYADKGGLLSAPDLYMRKFLVGPQAKGAGIDVTQPVAWNLERISQKVGRPVSELKGAVLLRPRHKKLIRDLMLSGISVGTVVDAKDDQQFEAFWKMINTDIKKTGFLQLGNLTLMGDGDLMPAFGLADGKIDFVLGAGGAPEGVISAAIIESIGGEMSAQLSAYEVLQESAEEADLERDFAKYTPDELETLSKFGIVEPGKEQLGQVGWNKVWSSGELASGKDIVVEASAVKDSPWIDSLKAPEVNIETGEAAVYSVVASKTGHVRVIKTTYDLGFGDIRRQIEAAQSVDEKASLYLELAQAMANHGFFIDAVKFLEGIHDEVGAATNLNSIKAAESFYKAMGVLKESADFGIALVYMEEALRLNPEEKIGIRDLLIRMYRHMADTALKGKAADTAIKYYQAAAEYANFAGFEKDLKELAKKLASLGKPLPEAMLTPRVAALAAKAQAGSNVISDHDSRNLITLRQQWENPQRPTAALILGGRKDLEKMKWLKELIDSKKIRNGDAIFLGGEFAFPFLKVVNAPQQTEFGTEEERLAKAMLEGAIYDQEEGNYILRNGIFFYLPVDHVYEQASELGKVEVEVQKPFVPENAENVDLGDATANLYSRTLGGYEMLVALGALGYPSGAEGGFHQVMMSLVDKHERNGRPVVLIGEELSQAAQRYEVSDDRNAANPVSAVMGAENVARQILAGADIKEELVLPALKAFLVDPRSPEPELKTILQYIERYPALRVPGFRMMAEYILDELLKEKIYIDEFRKIFTQDVLREFPFEGMARADSLFANIKDLARLKPLELFDALLFRGPEMAETGWPYFYRYLSERGRWLANNLAAMMFVLPQVSEVVAVPLPEGAFVVSPSAISDDAADRQRSFDQAA